MTPAERLARIDPLLLSSRSRVTLEYPVPRSFSNSIAHTKIRPGTYLSAKIWQDFSVEDQHLARILTAHRSADKPPVFSHISAAILLGLPIFGQVGDAVHTTVPTGSACRQSASVRRHRVTGEVPEITIVAGIQCTSVEKTLLDLACLYPAETSLSAIDGFLRQEFKVDSRVDRSRHGDWAAEMTDRLEGMRGERGVRRARQIFAIADPRVDSVLESISHLQLRRLGFEVDLQVPVPSPKNGTYFVDFEFVGLDLFGECDGQNKYLSAKMRAGLTAEQVVYREKRREEWICSTTGKRMIRWGFPDVVSALVFAQRLQAYGIEIPRFPR